MFQYISLYKQNASGQHLKVIGFTILQMIICVVIPITLIFGAMLLPVLLTFTDMSGEALGIGTGLWMLFIFLVWILVAIFFIYPIIVGILRYFASAYKGIDFTFGEAYKVFKGGNYSKLIKIALLVLVLYMALSFAIGIIINILMSVVMLPFVPLMSMMDTGDTQAFTGTSIALFLGFIVLMFIITIIAYIPYIIMYIYFAVVFMVYIDEPQIPTADKLKTAWNVAFRSEASMIKLFFSNLLLYILVTAVMFILFAGIGTLSIFMLDSPMLLIIIGIVGFIIAMIVSVYLSYLIVGSIVAYYFVGRDSLDRMAEREMTASAAPVNNNENIDLQ